MKILKTQDGKIAVIIKDNNVKILKKKYKSIVDSVVKDGIVEFTRMERIGNTIIDYGKIYRLGDKGFAEAVTVKLLMKTDLVV